MIRNRVRFSFRILGLSLLASYICAGAYVVASFVSAPSTGQSRSAGLLALLDPFVLAVAVPVATAVALLVFPVALFCVWDRNVRRCTVFVVGITALFTFFATLLNHYFGLFGGPIVGLFASVFCRVTHLEYFRTLGTERIVA